MIAGATCVAGDVPVLVTLAMSTGAPHVWPPSVERAACSSASRPYVRYETVTEWSGLTTGLEGASTVLTFSGVTSTGAANVCPPSFDTAAFTGKQGFGGIVGAQGGVGVAGGGPVVSSARTYTRSAPPDPRPASTDRFGRE